MQITDRIAMVTGASSGLGQRLAERLAARGAHLCLLGRSPERLEAVAATCRALGVEAVTAAGDIGDEDYVEASIALAEEALGPVDILVNCAGVSLPGRFALETIDKIERRLSRLRRIPAVRVCRVHLVHGRHRLVREPANVAEIARRLDAKATLDLRAARHQSLRGASPLGLPCTLARGAP